MRSNLRTTGAWARAATLALATAALLAGCGGGSDSIPLPTITSVKVMGDSLADVGTFGGVRATVQGTATAPERMYPELIAGSYGIALHCNFYAFTGTTFAANPTAGCTNYAIGGGRINGATAGMTAADPRNIVVQLQTAVAARNHSANDLLLIDGGGNDLADIIGAYLAVGQAAALGPAQQLAAVTNYGNALKTVLPAATVDPRLASAQGLADLGGLYMQALAALFHDQIKTNALDKGARYVVVLNVPAVTNTPRFKAVLTGIAAANGGGAAGAAAAGAAEALFKNWAVAFNTELAAKFNGNDSVLLIDFYGFFNDAVARPAAYGLTNVADTACPVTGIGGDGLPAYNFATCTSTALSTTAPPAGATGGAAWWRTYLFSDGFHPTPYAHALTASQIRTALFNRSWQ